MGMLKIGIAGASALGAGAAQLCAQAGFEVLLADSGDDVLSWAEARILRGLHRSEQPAAFSLVRKTTDFSAFESCDAALEASAGGLELKKAFLGRVDAHLPAGRLVAVCTGVLPVSILAASAENPERIVGLQFYQPPPVVGVCEVIIPAVASESASKAALELVAALGVAAVRVQDRPGFIVHRIIGPFFLEAMRLLEQGRGTPASIDAALRNIAGLRLGPFEMLDMNLDGNLADSAAMYELLGRPERLRPCAVHGKLVARGCRGRLNGRGFYAYRENPPGTVNALLEELVPGFGSRPAAPGEVVCAVIEGVLAEAKAAAAERVAGAADIDSAMRLALGWPKGPFELASHLGNKA